MLVTFEDLKVLYGMPYLTEAVRPQYTELLETAEEEVLEYAGLELGGEAVEFFEGKGARVYLLSRKPVLEVTAVTVSGAPVAFRFDPRARAIHLDSPAYGVVAASLVLGFAKVPRNIKKCIAETVQYWSKYINSNQVGVTTRTTDLGTETLEQWHLPTAVKSALDQYKNSAVVG